MMLAIPETLGLDPLPKGVEPKFTDPTEVEWQTADGVFVKQIHVRNAGSFLRQHAHSHDHTTVIAHGAVFVWQDGKLDKQYQAPALLMIKAGVWHTFMALRDDTVILCVHRLGNEIIEQHGLTQEDVS
jgi:quercetin dioxygenase-like cupin family protein